MTGPMAIFGEQMKQAADVAVKNINAANGILGKQVVLQIEDDANEPRQAVAVANRFIGHGVHYVVGHWSANTTLPASDVYAANDVLMITPETILSDVTMKGHKLIFRTIGTEKQLAVAIDAYLEKTYASKDKVLILTDNSAPGAQSTSKYVEKGLLNAGYKNINKEYFMAGTRDFSTLATKVKEIDPAVIYCSCFHVEAGLIMRAVRSAGANQPFVGWDMFNSPELWEIAGAAGEGAVYVSDPAFEENPSAREFVSALKAENIQPQTTSFTTYAAFQVLQQAIEKTHSLDPYKVAETIRKEPFDTAIGKISYAENGDLKNAKYQVYIHKNGQTIPLAEQN